MTVFGSSKHNPTYEYEIRPEMKAALDRYAEQGVPLGGFLTALLANDLMGALGRADPQNERNINQLCMYVHNEMPGTCHGSYEIIDAWVASHKLKKDTDKQMEEDRGKL